jgi:hypothetical protein
MLSLQKVLYKKKKKGIENEKNNKGIDSRPQTLN